MKQYGEICPVCGYNLETPPLEYDICPCCLFNFGISDQDWSYDELREDWIAHGALWAWGNKEIPEPPDYDPIQQLKNIPYEATDDDKGRIAKGRLAEDVVTTGRR